MTEPSSAAAETLVGRVLLGRYRVVRRLARGGMGDIFLGRHEGAAGFVRPVVIKRSLLAADPMAVKMFAREARILSNLRHPGIVSVLEFAEEEGAYLMVLDYVHGYNVAQWYRFVKKLRGPFDVDLAVHITTQVLDALEYAHTLRGPGGERLRIVHRDVKPSNILVDVEGHVMLSDFGVARANTDATDTSAPEVTLRGTFAYMAPELFRREQPGPRSDVYSAAVTLRELLTGRNEFTAKTVLDTIARVVNHTPGRVSEARSDVPPELDDAIARGMSKHPDGRYASAREFAASLRGAWRPPEDMAERFARAASDDFAGTALAAMHDTDPLELRARAWAETGGIDEPERVLPLEDAAQATYTARSTAFDSTPMLGPRRRRYWPWVAAAVAAVAGAAAAVVATRSGDSPEPTVVMVRGDVARVGPDGPPDRPAEPPPDPPPPTDLSAALRERQRELGACFQRHPPRTALPPLTVRVSIGTDGRATDAELLPAEVGAAPLGECLRDVARGAVFPPQPAPVVVRIPIGVTQPPSGQR